MYCSHISHPAPQLHSALMRALAFLHDTDLNQLPAGRHTIDGEDIFALVQELTTRMPNEAKNEFHRNYIDIQYLHQGEELIGFAPADATAPLLEDYLAERDVAFVPAELAKSTLHMYPGMYAIFFPGELHAPGLAVHSPQGIRKVVVKIRAALLSAPAQASV